MILKFEINEPSKFKKQQLQDFVNLLNLQGQIQNPTVDKIYVCPIICIVYLNDQPVGIGAIKQVYKTPFDKAQVTELKEEFNYELGYLYVKEDTELRGIGIGKTICKLLLKRIGNQNIFATTSMDDDNIMKFILEKLSFEKTGHTYIGVKTGKSIGLYLKKFHK